MKDSLKYALGFALVLIFFAVKSDFFKGSGEKGEIISIEQLNAFKKDKDKDGERMAIIGHPTIGDRDITIRLGIPLDLTFRNKNEELIDFFPINFGKEDKNSCYVPQEFTPEDLLIYDNEENPHTYGEDVMVSFTLTRITNSIPEQDPKTGEYAWRYEQIRIDPVE